MSPRQLLGVHLPSVVGRARADRGPLVLAGTVVALGTVLAAALPPAVSRAADSAVSDVVARAGTAADLVLTAPFPPDAPGDPKQRDPDSSTSVQSTVYQARAALPADLAAALQPPLASVTSVDLPVSGTVPGRVLQLAYVTGGSGARVTWTAGRAPGASTARPTQLVQPDSGPWPVQVGLSEQAAAALGVGPGDRVPARDPQKQDLDIRVSGIYRPVDPTDRAWQSAPDLLRPQEFVGQQVTRTAIGALLSADSLADARIALDADYLVRAVSFSPSPSRLDRGNAKVLAGVVVRVEASSGAAVEGDPTWRSSLDAVLRDARRRVATATAQAEVLLVGLVTTTALALLLAAEQLVRRRAAALGDVRVRGAGLPGLGGELLAESLLVTALGGAAGLLAAYAVGPHPSLTWPLPLLGVAALAPPALGVLAAARATGGRRSPANRSARRTVARTAALRRAALEGGVLLAALGALVALHQRGVVPSDPDSGTAVLLPALAPTLAAATAALVLLRLLPLAARLVVARLRRGRRSTAYLVAARTATTVARPLPFLVVTVSSALAALALCLSATQSTGQADGAWRSVGADAVLHTEPGPQVAALARRAAGTEGVRLAVPARVADVSLVGRVSTGSARLVVVDAAAFQRLLATTPLTDAPQLARLRAPGQGGVPALLRTSDPALLRGTLALPWGDGRVPLRVVGGAPPLGDGGPLVVVDAAAFAAAGADAPPDTVWATGPAAGRVLRALAGADGAVTVRTTLLHERQTSPLPLALLRLARLTALAMLLLALLALVLGSAASARERGDTLARLRTLGLRSREARRMVAGELLPPLALGALGGLALGVVLARAAPGPYALHLLTAQPQDPAPVVPWTTAAPLLVVVVGVAGVVAVESSLRRRQRLGQVLRVGAQ